MDEVKQMTLVGFYNFSSKDKTKRYYIVQALYNLTDKSNNSVKSNIINIYVNSDIYETISQMEIGQAINVSIKADLLNGKVYYSIVD